MKITGRLKTQHCGEFTASQYIVTKVIEVGHGGRLEVGSIHRASYDPETKILGVIEGVNRGRFLKCECDLYAKSLDFKEYIRNTKESEIIEEDRKYLKGFKEDFGFETEKNTKEDTIDSILSRLISERKKHKESEWERIAAIKIYNEHIKINL